MNSLRFLSLNQLKNMTRSVLKKQTQTGFLSENFLITSLTQIKRWVQCQSSTSCFLSFSCCQIVWEQARRHPHFLVSHPLQNLKSTELSAHANVLILSGTISQAAASLVRSVYDELSHPKWVVAFGACTQGGGPYANTYAIVNNASDIIPVDLYIPGCPPSPETFLMGLKKLEKLQSTRL